ncbi:ligase-associated DNA damage response endonuclease PdeM [Sphingoaurantiacus capsulatus]|uniref:Ligase-associated DNA damage response endonuclease PdeM n=1 Tax=Sphingoaurantiacus capsulatus TaxID=1771310 RepID=A0ABV7XBJ6_9SPHN
MVGVSVMFGDHGFVPLTDAALFWPARRALLVADLHFEKASWFASFGQLLPPYDSVETLARLDALVTATGATELWCLGDSFHDTKGVERMPARARDTLDRLTAALDWTWVVGNHDPGLDASLGGRVVDEIEVDGVMLRHEAEANETRPEISGHFHPKLRITVRGRRISRRCFVHTDRKIVLPAFGALTGGLDAADPAIIRAVGRPAQALVPTADRLLKFPLAA